MNQLLNYSTDTELQLRHPSRLAPCCWFHVPYSKSPLSFSLFSFGLVPCSFNVALWISSLARQGFSLQDKILNICPSTRSVPGLTLTWPSWAMRGLLPSCPTPAVNLHWMEKILLTECSQGERVCVFHGVFNMRSWWRLTSNLSDLEDGGKNMVIKSMG